MIVASFFGCMIYILWNNCACAGVGLMSSGYVQRCTLPNCNDQFVCALVLSDSLPPVFANVCKIWIVCLDGATSCERLQISAQKLPLLPLFWRRRWHETFEETLGHFFASADVYALCIACCDAHWKPRTYVHAWVSVCVCHVCGDFLARCGTCSASQSEIPVDPLHDEAPIDQYERKNKKATWSCLWIIWFVYVFWHQSWIILKEIVLQTCAIHLFT